MGKFRRLITHPRMIIWIVFLLLALVALRPVPWHEGVAIRSIERNGSAALAGIPNPKPTAPPMSREIILALNNQPVPDIASYDAVLATLEPNSTVQVKTNLGLYVLKTPVEFGNGSILGMRVHDAPKNNLRKGLDLQGGTRVILQPEVSLAAHDMETLLASMEQRLNIFGLSDVVLREIRDLEGERFILVEIAGVNEEEVKQLLARQGKFEAKIGNVTVFRGGADITYVCRTADCSGIDPQAGCGAGAGGEVCRFRFTITLTPEAARRQADATAVLSVIGTGEEAYLEQKLDLYLDNQLVDNLNIGAELKGRAVTDIQISGSGAGVNREDAAHQTLREMKRLQTVLLTGSLPVKIDIVKTDNISPSLGAAFLRNALLVGLFAVVAVALVLFLRYRKISISLAVMGTMLSEIFLLLGLAALIGWNIDLAAIAGIIVAIGTGVDDQIVILDEALRKKGALQTGWRQRFRNAFFIIFAAYFTGVASLAPLLFAGAGLLKGFAFTSIAGISFGVFVTRPAFAKLVEILFEE